MSNKVLIFATERGDFCVMNVPENYRPFTVRPAPESPDAYPRSFPSHDAAIEEARARHGRRALVIDETH